MQAPVLRRSPLDDIIWPALALVLVIAIGLGVANIDWSRADDAPHAAPQADLSLLSREQRYYDAKMARLDANEAAAGAWYVPWVEAAYWEPSLGPIDLDQFQGDLTAAQSSRARRAAGSDRW